MWKSDDCGNRLRFCVIGGSNAGKYKSFIYLNATGDFVHDFKKYGSLF